MSLRVRLTPEAQADLDEAQDWYDTTSPGLGAEFLDAVESTLRLAADWPEASPIVSEPMRRVLIPRFPYGVFYVVDGDELVVLGCIHMRRHPRVWKSRRRPPP